MLEDDAGIVLEGTDGVEPLDGLLHAGTTDGILLAQKTRDSAFHNTELDQLLKARGVEAFLLCGVSTESCVAATAVDAYAHDLRVGIVIDATASVRWDLHVQTLRSLKEQYRQSTLSRPSRRDLGLNRGAHHRCRWPRGPARSPPRVLRKSPAPGPSAKTASRIRRSGCRELHPSGRTFVTARNGATATALPWP